MTLKSRSATLFMGGSTNSDIPNMNSATAAPRVSAGREARYTLTPPAFMAVISLRRPITPYVTSTAMSTATGMMRCTVNGAWKAK